MELCERLKQIRKDNNLTQQEFADELCLSRTVITKYERGHKIPNLDTIIFISTHFKTSIFDEYKSNIKLFFLSIRCIIPYLLSLFALVISCITLVSNTIKINNQYGYNIYNDELKVKNSDEILIINVPFTLEINSDNYKHKSIVLINLTNKKIKYTGHRQLIINESMLFKFNYYLIFINSVIGDEKYKRLEETISHKPFIYPLKDYDELLPYNEQTGECSKILNYYIDLIEKVK